MTEEDFKQRYMITSVRGKVYGLKDMRRMCAHVRSGMFEKYKECMEDVLTDDAFMRFHYGQTPASLAWDVLDEAMGRLLSKECAE